MITGDAQSCLSVFTRLEQQRVRVPPEMFMNIKSVNYVDASVLFKGLPKGTADIWEYASSTDTFGDAKLTLLAVNTFVSIAEHAKKSTVADFLPHLDELVNIAKQLPEGTMINVQD